METILKQFKEKKTFEKHFENFFQKNTPSKQLSITNAFTFVYVKGEINSQLSVPTGT
jgi:hypothetical protein